MKALCQQHQGHRQSDDVIGARVNGRMRPNGADDRINTRTPIGRLLAFSASSGPACLWRVALHRLPRLHSHQA